MNDDELWAAIEPLLCFTKADLAGAEEILDYYREHKLDFTDLYPGLRTVVEQFAASGRQQAVLTNKPVKISRDQ